MSEIKDIRFIGWKIREIRKKRGMTLAALGEKIDPGNSASLISSLSGYEEGKNIPSALTLYQISLALRCEIDVFFEKGKS